MELLCKSCLYSDDCYSLYVGEECLDYLPSNNLEEYTLDSVITPTTEKFFYSCSTLKEFEDAEEERMFLEYDEQIQDYIDFMDKQYQEEFDRQDRIYNSYID